MGGYSFADHMFVLNCGLLAIVCAISTGAKIFIIIAVLVVAAYIFALASLGWLLYRDHRVLKSQKDQSADV